MLIFLVVLSLTLISICTTALRVTNYNETEAKILLNLAAGAYSLQPQDCVKNTLPSREEWIIYSSGSTTCDVIQSSCAFYTIRSDILKEIIIIFRGTKTRKQLFLEGWQSLNNGKNFLGVGMVNPYFSKAINKIWSNIEPLLRDPIFRSYRVTFTGHSLGKIKFHY
ncbi:unnamed protein product [Thelazia callipaeda]|uniref:Lipase_3 domain-containing protein n=1 Tax=Thelazia callipaeda TaxID=103827 RepID=A0A0N5CTJ7_THECL|nr:unnamed protein product [Thelazia callipaeda]